MNELEGVEEIDIRLVQAFEDHPFRVVMDYDMRELIESISHNGVIEPVIVRPLDDGMFEMISGHRRLYAAVKNKMVKIPALIKEMSDEEAVVAMVDANLRREKLRPSEKAFAFKMKMEAIKRQGKRNDLSKPQNGVKLDASDIVGKEAGISGTNVSRLIRLVELIPELLDMVDDRHMAITVAVEISFMSRKNQTYIYEYIKGNGMVKQEQLMDLRNYRGECNLTKQEITEMLDQTRSTSPKTKKITLTNRTLNKYFPAYYSQAEVEKILVQLMENWKQNEEQKL